VGVGVGVGGTGVADRAGDGVGVGGRGVGVRTIVADAARTPVAVAAMGTWGVTVGAGTDSAVVLQAASKMDAPISQRIQPRLGLRD
jgi:hypothetical protein